MRRAPLLWFVSLALLSAACAEPAPAPVTPRAEVTPGPPVASAKADEVELVESAPVETTLDHADVPDAAVVWPRMIDAATKTIDLAEFYASDDTGPTRLGPVLASLEKAVRRGVKVRFLADQAMAPKYPPTLERLKTLGASVRILDASKRYGGVQHAKYFVVDGEESFVGSQNFDWRALEHIQEMGVRVRSRAIAGGLTDLFETDWALAEPSAASTFRSKAHGAVPPETTTRTGETLSLVASPKGWLSDEARWDLDRIVTTLDAAKTHVDLQVLTYSTKSRDKSTFAVLDDALRRAAGRGVRVRVLVSHWGAKAKSPALASALALSTVPNVEVRVFTIPAWSGGDIPFARVSHAKFFVVDERAAWIGTSNWEGDYFLKTRNVAIVATGGALAPRLDRIFEDDWTSPYAAPLREEAKAP